MDLTFKTLKKLKGVKSFCQLFLYKLKNPWYLDALALSKKYNKILLNIL
jgi:hypothetical protein